MSKSFNKINLPNTVPGYTLPTTTSSEINLKFKDLPIPTNDIRVTHPSVELPHVSYPSYQIHETNQILSETNQMVANVPPDFYNTIEDKMVVNDGTSGSYEQFGGNLTQMNVYHKKYLKYKNKYIALKSKLGGDVPLDERTVYTNIYYSNNGDVNKIKEFFANDINTHYIQPILDLLRPIDTYIFNNFKKEEKLVFLVALNQEYLTAKKQENNKRLTYVKNLTYLFKRWYDDWHTYPIKESQNLEIIKDLRDLFDSI
jgi:hypothetical protein